MSFAPQRSALHRTALAGLLLAGAVAALLALVPSQAHAARGMEVTIQDDAVLVQQRYFGRDPAFGLLPALEVSRIRINIRWMNAVVPAQRALTRKPSTVQYDFAPYDALVDAARARGYRVNVALTGEAPAWAAGNRRTDTGRGTVRPNAKLYGEFARDVARHFGSKVDTYSIWNEPNHVGWLQPLREQGKLYRALYAAGYAGVKRGNRRAKVWFGELAPYASKRTVATPPLRFLRDAFCVNSRWQPTRAKCPTLRADAFAHHPYDFRRAPNRRYTGYGAADSVTMANLSSLTTALDRLARLRRLVKVKGSGGLDLQLTEYGYFASREPGNRSVTVFPERTRAKYLVQAFKIAQANRRVKSMLQYLLIQYPNAGQAGAAFDFDTSIVRLDGRPTRPYTELSKWARAAARAGQIRNGPGN